MQITIKNDDCIMPYSTGEMYYKHGEVISQLQRGELRITFNSLAEIERMLDKLFDLRDEVADYMVKNDPQEGTMETMTSKVKSDELFKMVYLNRHYMKGGEDEC